MAEKLYLSKFFQEQWQNSSPFEEVSKLDGTEGAYHTLIANGTNSIAGRINFFIPVPFL